MSAMPARILVGLLVAGIGLSWGAPDVRAQETKLSHITPATHNHDVNVIVPWVEEVSCSGCSSPPGLTSRWSCPGT